MTRTVRGYGTGVFSHSAPLSLSLSLSLADMYETVKEEVQQMRRVARQRRLFQLAALLGIDEGLLLTAPEALAET